MGVQLVMERVSWGSSECLVQGSDMYLNVEAGDG